MKTRRVGVRLEFVDFLRFSFDRAWSSTATRLAIIARTFPALDGAAVIEHDSPNQEDPTKTMEQSTTRNLSSPPADGNAGPNESDLVGRFLAPRDSVAERLEKGKALRSLVPRESLAVYDPNSQRQDPLALLEAQNRTRLPQLVPVRYSRMLTSPFAFLRGSAVVMTADLAPSPVTGISVQACGDMHVSNFGVYASAERNLVFAINDFDETLPGPWEWDLKRLVASAAVAARYLGGRRSEAKAAVRAAVRAYRKRMWEYARMGHLATFYASISEEDILGAISPENRRRAKRIMAKARSRTNLQVLDKMADLVDDQRRIVEQRPLIVRETHTHLGTPINEALDNFLQAYVESLAWDRRALLNRYRILDVARKVVGVGSVGTRCWVILMEGADAGDPLFLQYKEAQPSVLQPYAGTTLPFKNNGQRVVVGQRMIQGSPDIFLGWGEVEGVQFYVRQLRDMKGGLDLKPGLTPLSSFVEYCGLCGWGLALAHAKSGDAAQIAGYIGKNDVLDEAMVRFALDYAEQTNRDHDALVAAAKEGRIPVAEES